MADDVARRIDAVYRADGGRVRATLIRLLGSYELADEALHDAFLAAAQRWPQEGVPRNPASWLISAGRFKTIDRLRRRGRFAAIAGELSRRMDEEGEDAMAAADEGQMMDDQLRLIFVCCHPALPPDAQVAMTLREVLGLTTEEIARAYLARPPAIAQRIVRAKSRIAEMKLPFELPEPAALPGRLAAVLKAVYLMFNEGYRASAGERLTRPDLSGEAIRLGRLIVGALPEPEAMGLLALMQLHESRRPAREGADGLPIPIGEQDRALWDRGLIEEALALVRRAEASGSPGPYATQAAMAAVHAVAARAEETDYGRIVRLYDRLLALEPSPIVALNRAVAVSMHDGPAAGLAEVDALLAAGTLADFHLVHAARADFLRRLDRIEEARAAYAQAMEAASLEPERRFFAQRLAALTPS